MNLSLIFATSGLNPYKFDRDSNQECRSVPRQACEQVQRGMQCHQVILQLLHALSDSKHCLFAHSFALPKIWVNPVPENYPLMLQKKTPHLCCHNSLSPFILHPSTERNWRVQAIVASAKMSPGGKHDSWCVVEKVQWYKCANAHQMYKYSPNMQILTKCAKTHQMCKCAPNVRFPVRAAQ